MERVVIFFKDDTVHTLLQVIKSKIQLLFSYKNFHKRKENAIVFAFIDK